ncbi:MAG: hypothetical protein HQK86_13120 [Nitrospinae bacterium]|nr:hypothetical protein [Nitrospinota bacterium]MBF0635459.1 hypothetical protein [Nitrospinota bacterium]
MGEVKNQLFLQHISKSLEEVRSEFRKKHTPKKDNRFLIKGITYEIGACKIDPDGYLFEISSKIPQEVLPKKMVIDKYFKEVVKLINKTSKKPLDCKMENIIRSSEEEIKERDYVKLIYRYKENELYTLEEVEKSLRKHIAKGIPIPDAPGVATPMGKMVLHLLEESVKDNIRQNINDLIDANETIKKEIAVKTKAPGDKPAQKKVAPQPSKTVSKPKAITPAPRKASFAKPVVKKAVAKKAAVKKTPAKKPAVTKPAPKGKTKPSPSKTKPKKVKK